MVWSGVKLAAAPPPMMVVVKPVVHGLGINQKVVSQWLIKDLLYLGQLVMG